MVFGWGGVVIVYVVMFRVLGDKFGEGGRI